MSDKPRIFVDTAIIQYAAGVKLIQSAKLKDGTITSKNGERRNTKFLVYESNVKKKEADLYIEREKLAIREIAALALNGSISLFYSHEVNLELLFQPEVDLATGRMCGAPCRIVHSPLLKMTSENFNENDESEFPFRFWDIDKSEDAYDIYERVKNEFFRLPVRSFLSRMNFKSYIVGLRETHGLVINAAEIMLPFLMSIENKRYKEILKLLNLSCVKNDNRANLYLDAYHLWSAEQSNCEYFISTDGALLNQFKSNITKAFSPTNLVASLVT